MSKSALHALEGKLQCYPVVESFNREQLELKRYLSGLQINVVKYYSENSTSKSSKYPKPKS